MKIYIIGPVGSGKTTFSKKLAKKYHCKAYELDKIFWDDDHGNIKRSQEEVQKLFQEIIMKRNWVIEDVGRNCFIEGIQKADVVYYLECSLVFLLYRCIRRWIRQLTGGESYSYKPTLYGLFQMLRWVFKDCRNKEKKLKKIFQHNNHCQILHVRDIRNYE